MISKTVHSDSKANGLWAAYVPLGVYRGGRACRFSLQAGGITIRSSHFSDVCCDPAESHRAE